MERPSDRITPVATSTTTTTTTAPTTVVHNAAPAGTVPLASGAAVPLTRETEGEVLKEAAFAGREHYTKPYDIGSAADEGGARRMEGVKKNKHELRAEAEMAAAKDSRFGPAERIQAGLDAAGDKIKGALHGIAGGHKSDRT